MKRERELNWLNWMSGATLYLPTYNNTLHTSLDQQQNRLLLGEQKLTNWLMIFTKSLATCWI